MKPIIFDFCRNNNIECLVDQKIRDNIKWTEIYHNGNIILQIQDNATEQQFIKLIVELSNDFHKENIDIDGDDFWFSTTKDDKDFKGFLNEFHTLFGLSKHKLYFISTPYSHEDSEIKNIRYRQAIEYTAILMNQGKFAYSPIAGGLEIAHRHKLPTDWGYWNGFCEAMLERCDELHVLMLKGWEDSTGVKGEIEIATRLGIKIVYIDPNDVLVDTLKLQTHAQMLQNLKEYLESDEGRKEAEEYFGKYDREDRILESQLERFHDNHDERFVEILEKYIVKYNSKKYVDSCYSRGFEPDTPMFFFFYEYAQKYGRLAEIEECEKYGNMFTEGLYYIHGYFFNKMNGQGTVVNVMKSEEISC